MSSNGGGGSNLLDMGLMVAAGVAAPELAPELLSAEGGFMGLEGTSAAMAATGLTGAALSGAAAGITGGNVGRSALMGGIGGAASGYLSGQSALANAGVDPNVANQAAAQGSAALPAGTPMQGGTLGTMTPQELSQGVASGQIPMSAANQYGQAYTSGFDGAKLINNVPQAFNAPTNALYTAGGINALGYMGNTKPAGAYTPPPYKGGNLQKFRYDPNQYTPDTVVPPSPIYQANYSGMAGAGYADGGITALKSGGNVSDLGSYSDGGRLLKGPGDGMSDDIPATIGGKQEARLADGEFVVPADVVSGLGNGSTDAGAKHLYKMMDKVRHARTGRKSQAKQIKGEKYVPA